MDIDGSKSVEPDGRSIKIIYKYNENYNLWISLHMKLYITSF